MVHQQVSSNRNNKKDMDYQEEPKLRFKEFDESWITCKLGEVIKEFINGQTPSRNHPEYWNGEIPWVSSGELNYNRIKDTIEKITIKGKESANLKLLPKDTFLIAITGLEASGTRGSCAVLGIEATTNQSCMALIPKKDVLDSKFLEQWYLKVGEHYGIKYTQGTKQQSYNIDLLKQLPISLPQNIEEQEKIANFLSLVDKKMELLKMKYQHYHDLEKYLMQQIFTQELRFPNNNTEWEWLNFEDIFKSVSTKKYQIKNAEINTTGTYEVIDQGQKDIAGYHNDESKLFKELPIIIFGDHTTIVKYRNKPFIVGADGVKLLSSKINVDMKYMYYALNYFNIKPEGYKRHFSIIKKIDLPVPILKEQNQISSFFSAFDEKINFIQSQIEYMEEYKKGLLQKMFI